MCQKMGHFNLFGISESQIKNLRIFQKLFWVGGRQVRYIDSQLSRFITIANSSGKECPISAS